MIYAGILAAGLGVRMHRQDLPKPFLTLGSKPIIIHSLEQFLINSRVEKVIVVAADAWRTYAEDLITKHNTFGKQVSVITGGGSKTESVSFIVKYIAENFGINGDDILLTHDAIRPFVTQRIINDNIETALIHKAATTVMPTNDTIIMTTDRVRLKDVPEKKIMLAEQTPLTFNLKILHTTLEKAIDDRVVLGNVTELSRLFLQYGGEMHLVSGEYSNTKIINPYDLEIANALLAEMLK